MRLGFRLAIGLVAACAAGVSVAQTKLDISIPWGPTEFHTVNAQNFAKRVAIQGGRKLFITCRGTGSPTVVLEAGTGDLAKVWSMPPSGPGRAVFPAVARFTRVCAYDRPGTYLLPGTLSRSDPVAMPDPHAETRKNTADTISTLRRP